LRTRTRRCGAPLWRACRIAAAVLFQTQAELGAEMVEQVQQRADLPASWVVCDEWVGRHQALLDRVDAARLWYLAEIPRTTQVWPLREPRDARRVRPRPRAWLPPAGLAPAPRRLGQGTQRDAKGRKGTHERLHPDSPPAVPVETLAGQIRRRRWQRYRILAGRKGPIVADFVAVRALASRSAYREGVPGPEVWGLMRRPLPLPGQTEPSELKDYLSTAPADTPQQTCPSRHAPGRADSHLWHAVAECMLL
jgi:hypothetical protein